MITGSLVAIVTPMNDDGSLDFPRLRGLIDFHVAEGTEWHRDRRAPAASRRRSISTSIAS
jgi:hypothetical protein